jgi:hypothetical protein
MSCGRRKLLEKLEEIFVGGRYNLLLIILMLGGAVVFAVPIAKILLAGATGK